MKNGATCALAAVLASGALGAQEAGQSAESEPQVQPEQAIMAPLAVESLLLDVARAGERLVAVGERGHVLVSDDAGVSWKQSPAPTRAQLTAVHFVDAQHGWAVGHDEAILRSDDGGASWQLTHFAPEKEQPLLDVWFKDRDVGFAVGAYGTLLASTDGGRTWQARDFDPLPVAAAVAKQQAPAEEDEYAIEGIDVHLNAIVPSPDGKLYLAAEAGSLFRSDDQGETWRTLPSPYDGSFFGVLPLGGDALIAFGLRGNLFRSEDQGRDWVAVDTGTVAMLTDAARIDDTRLVVSGLAGTLLMSEDGGRTFTLRQQPDRKGIAALLALGAARFVVAGEGGVRLIDLAGAAP